MYMKLLLDFETCHLSQVQHYIVSVDEKLLLLLTPNACQKWFRNFPKSIFSSICVSSINDSIRLLVALVQYQQLSNICDEFQTMFDIILDDKSVQQQMMSLCLITFSIGTNEQHSILIIESHKEYRRATA